MEYASKDFYLCACILASGSKITKIARTADNVCLFFFDISPSEAAAIAERHWNGELLLPTRSVIDAIHELKTRIHEG